MKLTYQDCINLITNKIESFNFSKQEAKDVANVLVEAELRNDPSHGIKCLLKIIGAIKKRKIIPKKEYKIIKDEQSTALLDGEKILGPVLGKKAMELAIEKAKKYGTGAVSTKKTHHLFALSPYVKIATANDMIGIVTTNTTPAMSAPSGLDKVLGTNPIAIGIPSENIPIVLDMASTIVARGKVREAQLNKEKIPLTWALDKNGKPTDDPEKALEGSLQPIAGYKGFALALVIDALSGILSGSASGKEVYGTSMHAKKEDKEVKYKGDFFMAIDISKFSDISLFKSRVSKLINDIKNSKKAEGVTEITIPGEIEHRNKERPIEISDELYKEISNL